MDGRSDNWMFFVNALLVGALIFAAPILQQGDTVVAPAPASSQTLRSASDTTQNAGAATGLSGAASAPAATKAQAGTAVVQTSTPLGPPPVIRSGENEGGGEGGRDN